MSINGQSTYERLDNLCHNGITESVNLEFKRSDALRRTDAQRNELSKDISAMANSDGGVIIYGIAEDRETHGAGKLDDGVDQSQIQPKWIEQVANSKIHPKIEGLTVTAVSIAPETTNRVAYVVEVPRGSTVHMAADNKYYKRYSSQNLPMEDYEVRDTMARDNIPILSLEIDNPTINANKTLDLHCSLVNASMTPAQWCVTELFIPESLETQLDGGAKGRGISRFTNGLPATFLQFVHGGPAAIPIWRGVRVNLFSGNPALIRLKIPSTGKYPLEWRISSPGVDWRYGNATLQA